MGAKRGRDDRRARAAERKREQEARDRRQRRIVYSIAVPIAVLIIAAVPITNWYDAHQRGKKHGVGYVTAASSDAKKASCTGVRNDRQIETKIVPAKTTVDYAALTKKAGNELPPTSGPRESTLLPATTTFYAYTSAPRPEQAVGNLYHGYVIVWYDSKLPPSAVTALKKAVAAESTTIAVPWTRSVFPGDQHLVLTAWDRTQRCATLSTSVLGAFVTSHANDTTGATWASPSAPSPDSADTAATPSATPTAATSPLVSEPPSSALATTAPATAAPTSTAPTPASTATPLVTVSPVR